MEHFNKNSFLEYFSEGCHEKSLHFSEETIKKFCLHHEELVLWNRSLNLTGLSSDKERAILLFVDSLMGGLALTGLRGGSIVDIGSGGGFPGIPLQLAFPDFTVALMEPKAKKTAFLLNVIGKLGLATTSVLQTRLDEFSLHNKKNTSFDVAFSKALGVGAIFPHLNKIIKKSGKLVVFDGAHSEHLIPEQGIHKSHKISYTLPFGLGSRALSIYTLKQEP